MLCHAPTIADLSQCGDLFHPVAEGGFELATRSSGDARVTT